MSIPIQLKFRSNFKWCMSVLISNLKYITFCIGFTANHCFQAVAGLQHGVHSAILALWLTTMCSITVSWRSICYIMISWCYHWAGGGKLHCKVNYSMQIWLCYEGKVTYGVRVNTSQSLFDRPVPNYVWDIINISSSHMSHFLSCSRRTQPIKTVNFNDVAYVGTSLK